MQQHSNNKQQQQQASFRSFVERRAALLAMTKGSTMSLHDDVGSYEVLLKLSADKTELSIHAAAVAGGGASGGNVEAEGDGSAMSNILLGTSASSPVNDEDAESTIVILVADINLVAEGSMMLSLENGGTTKPTARAGDTAASSLFRVETVDGDIFVFDCFSKKLKSLWMMGLGYLCGGASDNRIAASGGRAPRAANTTIGDALDESPIRVAHLEVSRTATTANTARGQPRAGRSSASPAANTAATTGHYDPYEALHQHDVEQSIMDDLQHGRLGKGGVPIASVASVETSFVDERRYVPHHGDENNVVAARGMVIPQRSSLQQQHQQPADYQPDPTRRLLNDTDVMRPLCPSGTTPTDSAHSSNVLIGTGSDEGQKSPNGQGRHVDFLRKEVEQLQRMLREKNETIHELRIAVNALEERHQLRQQLDAATTASSAQGSPSLRDHHHTPNNARGSSNGAVAAAAMTPTPSWVEAMVQSHSQRRSTSREAWQSTDEEQCPAATAVSRPSTAAGGDHRPASTGAGGRPGTSAHQAERDVTGVTFQELEADGMIEGSTRRLLPRPATAGGRLLPVREQLADEALEALPPHPEQTIDDDDEDEEGTSAMDMEPQETASPMEPPASPQFLAAPGGDPSTSSCTSDDDYDTTMTAAISGTAPSTAASGVRRSIGGSNAMLFSSSSNEDSASSADGANNRGPSPSSSRRSRRPRPVSRFVNSDITEDADIDSALRQTGVTDAERHYMLAAFREIHGHGDSSDDEEFS